VIRTNTGIEDRGVDIIVDTDVLVIGGGGAACRAAIASHEAGARTTVVLKGKFGRSGATVAPGMGVAWQAADACSSGEDSPEVHFANIIDAGLGMADPRLARILAYEVLERMEELERWGLQFVPDPQGINPHYTGYSCFGDQPRAHGILNSGHGHAGDIVVVLRRQMQARGISVQEDIFVTDLVVEDGQCVGALALGPDGQVVLYRAGAVVLAAGGARQVFPHEKERPLVDTTGDGYAMALRAGAELTNMEYTQFMLHAVPPFPVTVPGSHWALFPKLRNRYGEDALQPYLPAGLGVEEVLYERTLHYPFSSRDSSKWLDIAFAREISEGRGTDEGGLYVDFSAVDMGAFKPSRPQHLPSDPDVQVALPQCPVQVRPAAHAVNGGVRIDERAASTVPGLFAAGEVAAGPHGADRLGGGMVTNCQVFGARAGRFAAEYALGSGRRSPSPDGLAFGLSRLGKYGGGQKETGDVLAALQEATATKLMVLRSGKGLKTLVARIQELTSDWLPAIAVHDVQALRRAIEVDNSLCTAELMAHAALMRCESRGSHFREDYPLLDDNNWRVNILLFQRDGRLNQITGTLG